MTKTKSGLRPPSVLFWTLTSLCLLVHTTFALDFQTLAKQARAKAVQELQKRKTAASERLTTTTTTTSRPGAPVVAESVAVSSTKQKTTSTAEKFGKVHGARRVSKKFAEASQIFGIASNLFLKGTNTSAKGITASSSLAVGFSEALVGVCPIEPLCSHFEPYRSIDGTCNNLFNTLQGAESTPQPRWLLADYSDIYQSEEPRKYGVSGHLLSGARDISNAVHQGYGPERKDPTLSLFLMTFGQLLSHDMSLTPITTDFDDSAIQCCSEGTMNMHQHPECFPITIPGYTDPYFPASYNCMNFVRSTAAINTACIPDQRQQVNLVTSYIDGSQIYGSTQEELDILRTMVGGELKVEIGPQMEINLPEDPAANCDLLATGDYCLLSGDVRVDITPYLSMLSTAFVREHNRLARQLAYIQPQWDDEKIFQETRKIVAAEIQHITYNEYLPIMLGGPYMSYFGLFPQVDDFDYVYNATIDASIVNVFAAAAFRVGHSQAPNQVKMNSVINGQSYLPRLLEETYFRPNMILMQHGADRIARYAATAKCPRTDGTLEQSVRNKLFKDKYDPYDTLDLAALNIQRGRDHGLPSYNEYRKLCGLPPYHTWQDALRIDSDHSDSDVAKLMNVYSDPGDIDVFTGAITEIPVQGGLVGPLNACLLGNQFRNLKIGDRFYYENPFLVTGFTLEQLNSIKGMTLAKIICTNMNTQYVQRRIFERATNMNPFVDCATLPDIDIYQWWSGYQPFIGQQQFGASTSDPAAVEAAKSLPPSRSPAPSAKASVDKFLIPSASIARTKKTSSETTTTPTPKGSAKKKGRGRKKWGHKTKKGGGKRKTKKQRKNKKARKNRKSRGN